MTLRAGVATTAIDPEKAKALIAECFPENRPEAELVTEEAEVITTCMNALVQLPRIRRGKVLDFLTQRFAEGNYLDILTKTIRSLADDLARVGAENEQLRKELEQSRIARKGQP